MASEKINGIPKDVMELYERDIEKLLEDPERVKGIVEILQRSAPVLMEELVQKGVIEKPDEQVYNTVLSIIGGYLTPTLERICFFLSPPDISQAQLSPKVPREKVEDAFDTYMLTTRERLISHLNQEIGFPTLQRIKANREAVDKFYRERPEPEIIEVEGVIKEVKVRRPRKYPYKDLAKGATIRDVEDKKPRPVRKRLKEKPEVTIRKIIRENPELSPTAMTTISRQMSAKDTIDACHKHKAHTTKKFLEEYEELGERVGSYLLVSKMADELKGKLILDLGCGSFSPLNEAEIDAEIIGLDFDKLALQIAKKEKFSGNDFFCAAAPYTISCFKDGTFDCVFAINAFQCIPTTVEKYATLLALDQLLKRDGKLVVINAPSHQKHYDEVKSFLERLGYVIEKDKKQPIDWPETEKWLKGNTTRHLILSAKKVQDVDRTEEWKKAIAMSYLETGYRDQAYKTVLEYGLNIDDVIEGVKEIEKPKKRIVRRGIIPKVLSPELEFDIKITTMRGVAKLLRRLYQAIPLEKGSVPQKFQEFIQPYLTYITSTAMRNLAYMNSLGASYDVTDDISILSAKGNGVLGSLLSSEPSYAFRDFEEFLFDVFYRSNREIVMRDESQRERVKEAALKIKDRYNQFGKWQYY